MFLKLDAHQIDQTPCSLLRKPHSEGRGHILVMRLALAPDSAVHLQHTLSGCQHFNSGN